MTSRCIDFDMCFNKHFRKKQIQFKIFKPLLLTQQFFECRREVKDADDVLPVKDGKQSPSWQLFF